MLRTVRGLFSPPGERRVIVTYAHISIGEDGVPHVAGTPTKVVEIALDMLALGWDAETIQREHPDLTLGQVHSALAYYFDHQDELDRDIAERLERADGIADRLGASSVRARLLAMRAAL